MVVVEIDDVASPPEGMWNEYLMEKIRYEIRAALNNLLVKAPAYMGAVDRVARKFNLVRVDAMPGLRKNQNWDGVLPKSTIINEG